MPNRPAEIYYGFKEETCFICGKNFVKRPESVYKVRIRTGRDKSYVKEVCSWTCFRKATAMKNVKSTYGEVYA